MNTTVENQTPEAAVSDSQSGLGQLGLGQLSKAIRQSMLYFVLATIVLIIAYALLIKKENEVQSIFKQVVAASQIEIDVLEMRENELLLAKTSDPSTVLKWQEDYKNAIKNTDFMLTSPGITPKETKIIKDVKKNMLLYKETFDKALVANKKRGIGDEKGLSGAKGELRKAGLGLQAELDKTTQNPIIESALSRARGISKDFIILERKNYVPDLHKAFDHFRELVQQSPELDISIKQKLINYANDYQAAFDVYAEATFIVNAAFEASEADIKAVVTPLPALTNALGERETAAIQQVYIILIVTAIILIGIFLLIVFQLRRAQAAANQTMQDTTEAQRQAEAENERLNDSVINILEAVNALSQKDLTARAPVTPDIIGTVSDSINSLADETARVLAEVTGVASQVSSVSNNVSSQAAQVSETAEAERQSVKKMFNTLFEATQTMNRVAALAEQSNESAAHATEVTEEALQTVDNTVTGMESIRETISETEKRIKRLGERSQEISGIVNLINTISERTHVLALNASMQAAVAGEAGRGFAVVAEEVQELAESSRNATEQIATLVNNIQIETNETINTVNRTIGQVVDGSEQAQQAGEQMRKTQEITAELVARVQSITQASQKQKNMSVDLLEAVQAIGDSTEKTAKQIAAQNAGTQELRTAAKTLVDSINVFKLPNQA